MEWAVGGWRTIGGTELRSVRAFDRTVLKPRGSRGDPTAPGLLVAEERRPHRTAARRTTSCWESLRGILLARRPGERCGDAERGGPRPLPTEGGTWGRRGDDRSQWGEVQPATSR